MFTPITRNEAFYNALVEECDRAASKATGTAWERATERAIDMVLQLDTILYDYSSHSLLIESSSEEGQYYSPNSHNCSCRGAQRGYRCYHRPMARIIELTVARLEQEAATAKRAADRERVYAEIAELFN